MHRAVDTCSVSKGVNVNSRNVSLVDETGGPLDPRIERVLMKMLPRFRRQFPSFLDEVALADVFEEAARRISRRETRLGTIAHLPGYAWVTLRTVATCVSDPIPWTV
jgi:alkylhydroperoxidase/carboxymuconolactone decarboxylase family protein YurZ